MSHVRRSRAKLRVTRRVVLRRAGVWRNGGASDSRSEGWEFESLCPQACSTARCMSGRQPQPAPIANTRPSPTHPQPRLGRAHGVVVSHPLCMRKALGSVPSVSIHARAANKHNDNGPRRRASSDSQRNGAVEACEAHNLKFVGSKPTSAIYMPDVSRPGANAAAILDALPSQRNGAVEACDAHNLKVVGSKPTSAISPPGRTGERPRADLNRDRWIQSPEC